MTVYSTLKLTTKPRRPLTPEQIAEIEACAPCDEDIAYDEDCPPSTPEQLAAFRRAAAKRNARLREAAQ